jgi:hypothetical protein
MTRLFDSEVSRGLLTLLLVWRLVVALLPDLSEWSARRRYSHAEALRRLYAGVLEAARAYLKTRERVMKETA